MKPSSQIKSVSYLKAHTADVIRQLREEKQPMIITQNGEARVVVQDIESYERTEETLALLKILALGNRQVEQGKVTPARSALSKVNERRKQRPDPQCAYFTPCASVWMKHYGV